jgi:hypothetical protein
MTALGSFFIYLTNYTLPGRRFHRLAYNLQDAKGKMQHLNNRRQRLQREIVELSAHVSVCRTCAGRCCQGKYNHFTVVDHLVRVFSDNPIADYGDHLQRRLPVYLAAVRKIARSIRGKGDFDEEKHPSPYPLGGCLDLTATGCRFKPEDRPIRCVLWTCSSLRRELSDDNLRRMGELTKELCRTSEEVIRAFQYKRGRL